MTTNNHQRTANGVSILCETIGISLLLIILYMTCYSVFAQWGIRSRITDHILEAILKTGLLDDPMASKFYSVVFLLLGTLARPHRKEPGVSWRISMAELTFSGLIFFLTPEFWDDKNQGQGLYIAYMVIIALDFLWIMSSASHLMRYIRMPWNDSDPWGHDRSGFPQLSAKIPGYFTLHLRAQHVYKGRKQKGWINLINPRRGLLIIGSPGAGKSRFIIEPLIRQLVRKGMAMLIYDFKHDALTRLAYAHWLESKAKYPDGSFYHIHFNDPAKSHRCNVLAPESLTWISDALGVSRTILLSLNKSWVDRQGDFFVESPIIFLGALIWFLRQYKNGIYCTLPHVIELARLPYDQLFLVLCTEPETEGLIDPFLQAYTNGTTEMLDGQVAGAKIPLARLASPDIYYILTGHDVDLHINDPKRPAILCLGGNPQRTEALTPVLSLYIDRLNRICNQPDQHPCAIVCDEFATVRAPALLTTIATGRSNHIIPIIAVQDMSQLRTLYSRDEADWILGVSGSVLCGQVGGETARSVSERFPKILREKQSLSVNSGDTSVTRHMEWEETVTPATVAGLSSGEFVGVTADDPVYIMRMKIFQATLIREKRDDIAGKDLPVVRAVSEKDLQEAYSRVKLDIKGIVEEIRREMMGSL